MNQAQMKNHGAAETDPTPPHGIPRPGGAPVRRSRGTRRSTARRTSKFVVTVEVVSYLDVDARDEDHARKIAERLLPREFGSESPGRSASIVAVEEA